MIISDLNYLEVAEANVEGGGFYFSKNIKTNVNVKLNIKKNVDAKVDVKGNLADAEAYATAYGFNSLAETLTVTDSTPFSSSAYSGSISAVD